MMTPRRQFILVGIDDNATPQLTAEVMEAIARARMFSGGVRHHGIVRDLLPEGAEWTDITVPLADVMRKYDEYFQLPDARPIVVFASGDPLFFGFGNTLMRLMPDARLTIHPWFNSLQLLAHRLPMSYDDMRVVSLTGRPWPELDRALIERAPKIGVLTDRTHTPAAIAQRLLDYGYTYYIMHVGERLGNGEAERIRSLTLEEAAQADCGMPNCLILEAKGTIPPRPYGIPDADFHLLDGRARMITKMPIRLLSLQAMDLPRRRVMWDVGFCTGSVSIEARLQFPHLEIVSFEVRPQGRELMDLNSRRHGAPGIENVMGDFLEADLSALPQPDAVFIGGHGGRLTEMLVKLAALLPSGGCVVMNSVTDASHGLFLTGCREAGLRIEPETHISLDEYNPITILKATKL